MTLTIIVSLFFLLALAAGNIFWKSPLIAVAVALMAFFLSIQNLSTALNIGLGFVTLYGVLTSFYFKN